MKYIIPNWKSLRVIGENKAVKLTMLTPIFGYLILFSDKFQSLVAQASQSVGISSGGASDITLINSYFLYFGLLSIAIASAMYAILAPTLVKEFYSNRDYVQENIDHITPSRVFGLSSFVLKEFSDMEQPHDIHVKISEFEKTLVDGNHLNNAQNIKLRELAIDLHNHFWNCTAYSHWFLRGCVFVFYLIGFLLLMVPSLKLFFSVVFR
ncbi:hypothetical protein [Vibrio diabolicus]